MADYVVARAIEEVAKSLGRIADALERPYLPPPPINPERRPTASPGGPMAPKGGL